jgi:hypothetical protein
MNDSTNVVVSDSPQEHTTDFALSPASHESWSQRELSGKELEAFGSVSNCIDHTRKLPCH